MHIVKEYINTTLLTSKRNYRRINVMFKNGLHMQVLTLISLLLIKITSSNFQEMFIKASSFLLFKYLNFEFYTL